MKISCNVIKDLLPLYYDDVCSSESRALVETHIQTCESCKNELQKYDVEYNLINKSTGSNMEEARPIKSLAKKWHQGRKRAFLLGILIVSLLGCVFSIYSYNAAGSYVAPDGTLVEAFGFIPMAYFFALSALISLITLGIISFPRYKH